ncbi:TSCPD domain-containing protein [Pelagibaculum spongiae]|uniref:ribonucleoside-diphosphate reductase n=1 Tax=Pelagibaculum spongiae TaxID=2080658 RepID=A0A2V1GWI9_9GAMM|nr:NrdJb [Pelagibaculum spongiae]PVZ69037.1 NrdJb [Pelagibaculum spongiae]
MVKKIESKIVGFQVKKDDKKEKQPAAEAAPCSKCVEREASEQSNQNIQQMHEKLDRPEMLVGNTYKIKTPLSEHALYVTINDIILNHDTEHQQRRPFEMFINSKNMDQFMWVVALTRVLSAVFRKGGDVKFLVEELKAVFDPQGGYFKSGGKYMPSLVAEIGDVLETHLTMIGMIQKPGLDVHQKKLIAEKKAQMESQNSSESEPEETQQFPPNAQLCKQCMHKSVIIMDGCETCLNCGASKCG